MAYRTLETVLHPDSHLALPLAELPLHPVRVMVTILEDDETDSLADSGDDDHETLANGEERSSRPAAKLRSPRLADPDQSADFAKEIIEVSDDARV